MDTQDIESMKKQNADLLLALRAVADRAYCQYIEQMSRDECKGVEYKLANGKFGQTELDAHNKGQGHLAVHRAMHQFIELHSIGMHRPAAANAGGLSPGLTFYGYSDYDEYFGETILDYVRERDESHAGEWKDGDTFNVTAMWTQEQEWRVVQAGNPFEVERVSPASPAAEKAGDLPRYDIETRDVMGGYASETYMAESKDGDWVRYEDVTARLTTSPTAADAGGQS